MWVEKDSLPLYLIPEDIRGLIENDTLPKVLEKPLSCLTYKDYFAALLYAEQHYNEVYTMDIIQSLLSYQHCLIVVNYAM